jgi:hypothetical protein
MPPEDQRRNTAYLDRSNYHRPTLRLRHLSLGAAHFPGLAIDLGGSVERCFRPVDLAGGFSAAPRDLGAAETKGISLVMSLPNYLHRFVLSNG